jgi:hypothetical protein
MVYEVTSPSAYMINRITKIVQSMFQLLSGYKTIMANRLSAQMLSPFFLVLLGFRSSLNRAAAMTHEFLSFFDDSFGSLAQLLPLLIQVVKRLPAALAQQVPRFFAREQRGHSPTDGH